MKREIFLIAKLWLYANAVIWVSGTLYQRGVAAGMESVEGLKNKVELQEAEADHSNKIIDQCASELTTALNKIASLERVAIVPPKPIPAKKPEPRKWKSSQQTILSKSPSPSTSSPLLGWCKEFWCN